MCVCVFVCVCVCVLGIILPILFVKLIFIEYKVTIFLSIQRQNEKENVENAQFVKIFISFFFFGK